MTDLLSAPLLAEALRTFGYLAIAGIILGACMFGIEFGLRYFLGWTDDAD